VKRDYRLPIAKRFGRTAARTFDTSATEIVTVGAFGVLTFFDPHSPPRVDCTILLKLQQTFTTDTLYIAILKVIFGVFSNFYGGIRVY